MPTVLITGANRGLGLEYARQYSQQGWTVLACARNTNAPELGSLVSRPVLVGRMGREIVEMEAPPPSQADRLEDSGSLTRSLNGPAPALSRPPPDPRPFLATKDGDPS